jgi:hypothetical protein
MIRLRQQIGFQCRAISSWRGDRPDHFNKQRSPIHSDKRPIAPTKNQAQYKYLGTIKNQLQNPALTAQRTMQGFIGFIVNCDHRLNKTTIQQE